MKFTKKPTTIDEQIEILKSRGVKIDLPNYGEVKLEKIFEYLCR